MHSPSSNTSGPDAGHWQPPSDPHLQALVSSTDVQPTLPPHEGPAFPVPQTMPAAVQPMTADIVDTRGSPVPFPAPQRTWTMSSGPTPPPSFPPLRNIQSVPELSTCTHSPPTQHSDAVAKGNALRETLVYPEGEIPLLDKDSHHWSPIRSGPLATRLASLRSVGGHRWNPFSNPNPWIDATGVLLDNYFLLVKNETSPTGSIKASHVIKPIPVECLQFIPFDDDPEVRKKEVSLLSKVKSNFRSPTKLMYPFQICHNATYRRHTLYTQSATERNRWHSAFVSAVEERNSQKDWNKLYVVHTLNNGSFRVPSCLQLTHGVHDTGRVVSAAGFLFQGGRYIAVGCTSGIYVNKRGSGNSFKKVMEFNEPNSMVAIPEFNKFLVHCESALFSYPLDMVVRVSQGDATLKNLDDSGERLAQEYGDVTLLKAGSLDDRTLVIYTTKTTKQVSSHALELTHQAGSSKIPIASYKPLGSPVPIPEDPHDAMFFQGKVAICASKCIYISELENVPGSSPTVVPNFPNSKRDSEMLQLVPTKRKGDTTKILDLVRGANILGMVPHEKDILLIYDDLGCFVGKDGKPARSSYYVEWEVTATTYALRGLHLLLFSLGYIEVRNIDTGQLVSMVKTENDPIRLLRSGLIERALLIAVMACAPCGGGGHTEKLVELVYHDPNVLDAQVAMVPAK